MYIKTFHSNPGFFFFVNCKAVRTTNRDYLATVTKELLSRAPVRLHL